MEEIDILEWVHGTFDCTVMDYLSLTFEYVFKVGIVWVILALLLIYTKRHRTFGAVLLLSIILEFAVCLCLKFTVGRPRPFETYSVDALVTSFQSSSFPSSHTAQLFCVATVFAVFCREYAPEMFILAFTVAFTRMYMFAHYPSDVFAGAVIGIICALAAVFLLLRTRPRIVFVKSRIQPDPEDAE